MISRDNESVQHDYSYQQRLELKVHELEMERMYEEDLFANSYLSPAHKIVLLTIRKIIHNLRIDETSPTIIHLNEIVNKTALSEKQIRRLIQEMHEWGLITKETKKLRNGKVWESEMTIAIGGKIKSSPKNIVTDHKRPGGFQRCHECGSLNIEPVVYKCRDCGHHGPMD